MREGLILSIVCVAVVFSALFILYLFYGLIGKIFTAASRREKVLDQGEEGRIAAAIATALEMELGKGASMPLTARRGGGWHDTEYSFRKNPR